MKLLLCSLTLLIDRHFFLVDELSSQLMHALLIVFNNLLALDTNLTCVLVLQAPDLILVTLDDPLDLRLQPLDCLRANLMDLFLFPALLADLLSRRPSLLILLQLNLQPIIDNFLLLSECPITSLHRFEQAFNFAT